MHDLVHRGDVRSLTAPGGRWVSSWGMKIPRLVWNRRHNVAALTVSYGRRVWNSRQVGDVILGYNAAGRLCRVVLLDPRTMLPKEADEAQALEAVTAYLLREGGLRQPELEVLRSALDRAVALSH
jgi:hypothetical protein